ncbi:hypothetical protein CPS_3117 [Colwellia psychrerythraea 34H]|uniref:Uncharacterized protein n=1 Tax=Colwellia psychrerythraea (strain 34H / ATCC BAA-681) TaxID=167879 RepID=Q47ZF6_COLP3|nr:hypothetical protein CPS_3117 [Colwellia psychrerythraea 34H]
MPHAFKLQQIIPKLSISLNKLVLLSCLLVIIYFGYERYEQHTAEQTETSVLILTPKVNDIYFLDFRLLSDKLERKNKYKLAKVVRVSDDNVAIVYGSFFYQWQYSVVNSIQYGDLSNDDYFMLLPEYIPFTKIKEMRDNGAIYLVKRPVRSKLYGNFVSH